MTSKESPAVSVIDEASNTFYGSFGGMPEHIKKSLSCEMLHNIFKYMVVPSINEVRRLDRET